MRSSLQSNLFLVDPSQIDVEAHSAPLFDDTAVDLILSHHDSSSPIPPLRRPNPPTASSQPQRYPPSAPVESSNTLLNGRLPSVLHQGLPSTITPASARQAILTSFSHLTRATRHAAQNILSHPLAKPIVPHLPDPVRSLVNAEGVLEGGGGEWAKSWVEKGGVGEFESARVYLAKWARVVAEQGERARQSEAYASVTGKTTGEVEETSDLGVFELLAVGVFFFLPHSTRSNNDYPLGKREPSHPEVNERSTASY